MRDSNAPYWLLKADDAKHGFTTVPNEAADTPAEAVRFWREGADQDELDLLHGLTITAALVTLSYVDGQPVVTEVS